MTADPAVKKPLRTSEDRSPRALSVSKKAKKGSTSDGVKDAANSSKVREIARRVGHGSDRSNVSGITIPYESIIIGAIKKNNNITHQFIKFRRKQFGLANIS